MRQTLSVEGLLSMRSSMLILQIAPEQPINRVPFIHQVAQEGLVAARGVFHILKLELKDQRINPVPVKNSKNEKVFPHSLLSSLTQ